MLVLPPPREPVLHGRLWNRFWYTFLGQLVEAVNGFRAPSYTVATLPTPGRAGRVIFVTDETGGAVLAFDDGSSWRRVTDRAVVS